MKKIRKIISSLAVMTILFSVFTVNVFASETATASNGEELNNLITNSSIGKIQLVSDVELETAISVEHDVILDLNGKTLTLAATDNYAVIVKDDLTITGNGTVKIKGIYGFGIPETSTATLTIDNGTFVGEGKDYVAVRTDYMIGAFSGKVVINNGTFKNAYSVVNNLGNATSIEVRGGVYDSTLDDYYTLAGKNISVTGGTFKGVFHPEYTVANGEYYNAVPKDYFTYESNNAWYVEKVDPNNVSCEAELLKALEIGATNIKLDSSFEVSTAVITTNNVTIDLNGKTISAPSDTSGDGIFMAKSGTLTINDSVGTAIVNGLGKNDYNMALWANGGTIVINGGTYTNVGAGAEDHYDLIYAGSSKGAVGHIVINGGTFVCHTPKWTLNISDKTASTITVNGGSFYKYDPSSSLSENPIGNFLAKGKIATLSNDYYVVNTVDNQNIKNEKELLVALDNKASNIKLGANFEVSTAVEITHEVKIDLNGKKISAPNDTEGNGIFWIKKDGNLTITGTGVVDASTDKNDYRIAIWVDGGVFTADGGHYTNADNQYSAPEDHYDLIYVKNGGKAYIKSGSFKCVTPKWTLNLHDTTANNIIIVESGLFDNYNPAESETEPGGKVSFVKDPNYCIFNLDNQYLVSSEHTWIAQKGKEATCMAKGEKAHYSCFNCAKLSLDETNNLVEKEALVIDYASHTMTHVGATSATCKDTGLIEHYSCSVCKKFFTDEAGLVSVETPVVAKLTKCLTSTLVHKEAKASTCTKEGNVEHYQCSVCKTNYKDSNGNNKLSSVNLSKKSHSWGSYSTTTAATCTTAGTKTRTCSSCGGKDTSSIEAKGHSWSLFMKNDDTNHYYVCNTCGDKKDVAKHSFNSKNKCTVCGFKSTKVEIEVTPQPTTSPIVNEEIPEIVEKIKTSTEKEVIVDVTKEIMIDTKAFEALVKEDKTLVLETETFRWTFDSKDIEDINAINDKEFNANVSLVSPHANSIVTAMGESANNVIHVYFEHHGKLPGKATVEIFVGKDFAGMTKYLYHYLPATNNFEYITEVVVGNDGWISFEISHCSDYVLNDTILDASLVVNEEVKNEEIEENEKVEEVTKNETTTNEEIKTEEKSGLGILPIVAIIIGTVIGVAVFFFKKKKV